MNFDNGDGSGIRRLTESQRLKLMADMEHEEDDCAELDTNTLAPPLSLPPPPAAEAGRGLALMVQNLYGRTQFEADEVDGEVVFL